MTTHWLSATSQWFANLDSIKDDALRSLVDVHFHPPQCAYDLITSLLCLAIFKQLEKDLNLSFNRVRNGAFPAKGFGAYLYPRYIIYPQLKPY